MPPPCNPCNPPGVCTGGGGVGGGPLGEAVACVCGAEASGGGSACSDPCGSDECTSDVSVCVCVWVCVSVCVCVCVCVCVVCVCVCVCIDR
jgi:hypothetical protein